MDTKVEQQIECTSCPWDKNCVSAPTMTEEEVKSTIEKTAEKGKDGDSKMFGSILSVIVFGGKDRTCPACMAFISKLREGPELSNKIKEFMKES